MLMHTRIPLGSFAAAVSVLALYPALAGQQPASVAADLVLLNGKIVTVETEPSEVEALAVGGNQIAAMGTTAAMKRHVGAKTQVIDLRGRLVVPGLSMATHTSRASVSRS